MYVCICLLILVIFGRTIRTTQGTSRMALHSLWRSVWFSMKLVCVRVCMSAHLSRNAGHFPDGIKQLLALGVVFDEGVDQERVGLGVDVLHRDLKAVEAARLGELYVTYEKRRWVGGEDAAWGPVCTALHSTPKGIGNRLREQRMPTQEAHTAHHPSS